MTVLILSLLLSPPELELNYMPPGSLVTLPSGDNVKCFTFPEYKVLLELDENLRFSNAKYETCSSALEEYDLEVRAQERLITALHKERELYFTRANRLQDRWMDAEKRCLTKPIIPSFVGLIGGVVGIIGASLWAASLL